MLTGTQKDVQLAAHATDHSDRFTEVHLRMSRRMRQRHKLLRVPLSGLADVVGHDGVAAIVAMLVAEPLKDPFGRVPLLPRRLDIRLQDRIDDRNVGIEFWFGRRLLALVARRHIFGRLPPKANPGTENRHILPTISRLRPKTLAASRLLWP